MCVAVVGVLVVATVQLSIRSVFVKGLSIVFELFVLFILSCCANWFGLSCVECDI